MLGAIKSWWERKHQPERSSKKHERLTDHERVILAKGKCPDCGGGLLEGPHGGLAANYCCAVCHSEFNLTFIAQAVIGERISDAGPREVGDRAWAYGL